MSGAAVGSGAVPPSSAAAGTAGEAVTTGVATEPMANALRALIRWYRTGDDADRVRTRELPPAGASRCAPDQYGVVGHPISHSWSPFIHGLFAKQTDQSLVYRLYDIAPENFRAHVKAAVLDVLSARVRADGYRTETFRFPALVEEDRTAGSTLLQRLFGVPDVHWSVVVFRRD